MPRAHANGLELQYETFGEAGRPTLLLVMGLGCQLVHWDTQWCQRLAQRGFRVVRFDNRDIGLSTKFRDLGVPNVVRLGALRMAGLPVRSPYALDDMADDALALLDALDVPAAHVVGVSLGGMVAQLMALRRPERVLSLCSWMSTPGQRRFLPTFKALKTLVARAPDEVSARIEHSVKVMSIIGSPAPLFEAEAVRRRAAEALARNKERAGFARQLAAVLAAPSRTKRLQRLATTPTLVMHGDADPLIPIAAGRATARAIAGARWVRFAGVGHDIPEPIWEQAMDAIEANVARCGPPSA